jgi:hypothetical protein
VTKGAGKRGANLPRDVVYKHFGFAGLDRVKRLCRRIGNGGRVAHSGVDLGGAPVWERAYAAPRPRLAPVTRATDPAIGRARTEVSYVIGLRLTQMSSIMQLTRMGGGAC